MQDETSSSITKINFPYDPQLIFTSFVEDKIIFVSSKNAFFSYKNDILFLSRIINFQDDLADNRILTYSFPFTLKSTPIIKTSYFSRCGHLKCTCINQYGTLSNFAANECILSLYFGNNLIITYKLSWNPAGNAQDDIGLTLTKDLEFRARKGNIACISLDDSGDYLACSYFDSNVLLYKQDNIYRSFQVENAVMLMRFHGKCIYCSTNQGEVYIYYIAENAIRTCTGHNSLVSGFSFLSFSNTEGFLSSSFDSTINFYMLNNNAESKHPNLEVCNPSKQFIFSSPVLGILVYNTNAFDEEFETNSPWLLLAVTESATLELVDPVTSTTVKRVETGANFVKRAFFFDKTVVLLTKYFDLEFYDVKSFGLIYSVCGNFDKCYYTRFISSSLTEAQASLVINGDEKVRLISLTGNNLQVTLYKHPDIVLSADILEEIIATGSKDGVLIIFNLLTLTTLATITASQNTIVAISLLKQSSALRVVTADFENILKLWSIDGTLLHLIIPHAKTINHISISPNHKMIATSSSDKTLKLYKNNLEVLGVCQGHSKSVNYSIFIERDMLLFSASTDNLIKCWNPLTFECVKTFQGHENPVLVLTQVNNTQIASGDVLGFIKIWNIKSTLCVHTLQPHNGKIWHMNLYLEHLVTCGDDGLIILWKYSEDKTIISPAKERIKEQTEIDSLLASKKYLDALFLAVRLDMTSRALDILASYSEFLVFNNINANAGGNCVDKPHFNLYDSLIGRIIGLRGSVDFDNVVICLCHLIRVCISNSKLSNIGNCLLSSLFKHCSTEDFKLLSDHLKLNDMLLLESKHYNRIFHMSEKARLLDLLVQDVENIQGFKTLDYLTQNSNN